MDDFLKAAILGVVEGITEFLPVSSTGHLVLANEFVKFADAAFTQMFDIVIQLGAILAVAVVFWKRLWPFSHRLDIAARKKVWTLWGLAIVGFIPTGIGAFLLAHWVEGHLFNPMVIGAALVFYGIILLFIEKVVRRVRVAEVEKLGWKFALVIGAVQLLSLVPGTSRSGVTIIGALLLGVGRVAATEYTFFLALPTMVAATGYSLYQFMRGPHGGFSGTQLGTLTVGFVVSFLVAWFVIAGFLKFIQKRGFVPFGVYRVVFGLAVLAWFGWKTWGG
jgi:undecaprenyl-diphosphatase